MKPLDQRERSESGEPEVTRRTRSTARPKGEEFNLVPVHE